jgi:hypothetical protein
MTRDARLLFPMLLLCGLAAAQTTTTTVKKPAAKTPPIVKTNLGGYAPPGESAYPVNQVPAKPKVGPAPAPAPAPSVPVCPQDRLHHPNLSQLTPAKTIAQNGAVMLYGSGPDSLALADTAAATATLVFGRSGTYSSYVSYPEMPETYTAVVTWGIGYNATRDPIHSHVLWQMLPTEFYSAAVRSAMKDTGTMPSLSVLPPGAGIYQFKLQIYACHL